MRKRTNKGKKDLDAHADERATGQTDEVEGEVNRKEKKTPVMRRGRNKDAVEYEVKKEERKNTPKRDGNKKRRDLGRRGRREEEAEYNGDKLVTTLEMRQQQRMKEEIEKATKTPKQRLSK